RHTRFSRDWSSDVCSSDLYPIMSAIRVKKYESRGYKISKNELLRILLKCSCLNISSYDELAEQIGGLYGLSVDEVFETDKPFDRSEERRVGKECRSRW